MQSGLHTTRRIRVSACWPRQQSLRLFGLFLRCAHVLALRAAELLASAAPLRCQRLALQQRAPSARHNAARFGTYEAGALGALRGKPNPSLNRTRYGSRRKPSLRQSYYRRSPGLRRLPPQAG